MARLPGQLREEQSMGKIATLFLDLDKIADSGQCFRWRKVGDREYIIPAFGKELHVKQDGEPFPKK